LFDDGSNVQIDIASAIMERRRTTFVLPKPLAFKQTVYILLPQGIVQNTQGAGNYQVQESIYSFSVTQGDAVKPQFDFFTSPVISAGNIVTHNLVLYFSEAMQMGSGVTVAKASPAANVATNTTIHDNKVTVQAAWESAVPYRFNLPTDAFKDLAGNSLTSGSTLFGFLLGNDLTYTSSSDSSGFVSSAPFRVLPNEERPANNSVQVVPSSNFKVAFSDSVQAGIGDVLFDSIAVPAQDCVFLVNMMFCDPPGDMAINHQYLVTLPPTAVQDSSASATISETATFMFTTIDLDLIPPVLNSVSTGMPPFVASEIPDGLSRGSVLSLSFSEVVQAGSGAIVLLPISAEPEP
jgi:hypothetical protein